MKNLFIVLSLTSITAFAQVGIGTTTPNAQLEVQSTNQAAPANTDGVIIPKADTFPATNPTALQQGMLLYLTTSTTFLASTRQPGFYYWNDPTSDWIGISSTVNGDADWYEVGTSTAPDAITDDMFHTGNVAIGKNTTSYPLEISTTNFNKGVLNTFTTSATNGVTKYGIDNQITTSSNDIITGTRNSVVATGTNDAYGILNAVDNAGSTGFAIYNQITGSGNGGQLGTYNTIFNTGSGNHIGTGNVLGGNGNGTYWAVNNSVQGNGSGDHTGTYNLLGGTGGGIIYGNSNLLSNTGNGQHFGTYSVLNGTGTGDQFGIYNGIINTGSGIHYGSFNALGGTGSGIQYGTYTDITNSGNGNHVAAEYSLSGAGTGGQYGTSTTITNSGNSTHYGSISRLSGSGSGIHYGSYNILNGNGTGNQIASYNQLNISSPAPCYSIQNTMNGTGNGNQYGTFTSITNTGSGSHYGLFTMLSGGGTADHNANYSVISGSGSGIQTGIYSEINNTGAGTHYGLNSALTGTGAGTKYGISSFIDPLAGGTQYGVYSSVLKAGTTNFAGYFLGNVGIGTTAANTYTFPASRGTNQQIMQTNGAGVVSWQTPNVALNPYAWTTTGNSGTTAAANFIGTTDANDFVTKTGGNAAANERLRVTSIGDVVVNSTSIFNGDVFSVYGNNTSGGGASISNSVGNSVINGYASGSGIGMYANVNGGANTSGVAIYGSIYATATTTGLSSEGVLGQNSASSTLNSIATGVRGEFSGTTPAGNSMAVLGINSGSSGAAYGVFGQTASPGAFGVFGYNIDVSANPSHGIQGQTGAVGLGAGVRGFNIATAVGAGQSAFGVRGSVAAAPTGTGYTVGVRGDASGATGSAYGLYGTSVSSTGMGAFIVNTNTSGTGILCSGNNTIATYLAGGSGISANGTTIGALGYGKTPASGVGVLGVGNNGTAVVPTTGTGVLGIGAQYGVMGFATTTVNTNPSNNSASNAAAGSAGGYFEVQNAGVAQAWAYVGVRDNTGTLRKIIGTGTVNTIVNDMQGKKVALSCPEAPENLFQDYGQGQLINGKVHITIDPVLSKNIAVNDKHPLRVFVQLEGDCEGVFVSNKTQNGFDVTELKNGASNVAFSYTIVANRADEANPDGTMAKYSEERFPAAPGPQVTKKPESKDDNSLARNLSQDDKPVVTAPIKVKPDKKLQSQK